MADQNSSTGGKPAKSTDSSTPSAAVSAEPGAGAGKAQAVAAAAADKALAGIAADMATQVADGGARAEAAHQLAAQAMAAIST